MSKTLSPQLLAAQLKIKADTQNLLVIAATEAVNHFKANFKVGGFVDRGVDKWKPRKVTDAGRGILIGPKAGGTLKKSIARSSMSATRVIIGIKDRKTIHTRKDGSKYSSSTAIYGSVHNFGLRSGRKAAPFKMPQRKFMGDSHKLNQKISRLIKRRLNKIL